MRTWTVPSSGRPQDVWPLIARPALWHRWAPHVSGAWGLGAPEVRKGAIGVVRVLGVAPVPARIVGKRDGRSWTWRVGLGTVEMVHRITPRGRPEDGCDVSIDVIAAPPIERTVAALYGPVIEATLQRLARIAAEPGVETEAEPEPA